MKKLILSLALLSAFYTPLSIAMDQDELSERDGGAATARCCVSAEHLLMSVDPVIGTAAMKLHRPNMSDQDFKEIVAVVKNLPEDSMQDIVDATARFVTQGMISTEVNSILNSFRDCDEDPLVRADRMTKVLPEILRRANKKFSGFAIYGLIRIPTGRFGGIVTAIAPLITQDMNGICVQFILESSVKCDEAPQDRVDRITRVLPTLLNPDDKIYVGPTISILLDIPTARFEGIVTATQNLLSRNMMNDIVPMIAVVRDLPEDRMDGIVQGASMLIRPDMGFMDRRKILDALSGLGLPNEATIARAQMVNSMIQARGNPFTQMDVTSGTVKPLPKDSIAGMVTYSITKTLQALRDWFLPKRYSSYVVDSLA